MKENPAGMARPVCWVVVLGDFGRSPRMQYHTVSMSKTAGYEVHVVAYSGAAVLPSIAMDPAVHIHSITSLSSYRKYFPRALALILKAAHQALALLWAMLFRLPAAEVVLMQCPPAVPTIMLCVLTCWLRGSKLIIDWHNFAFSLLALSLTDSHPLVRVSLWCERNFGRMAHQHLCVTRAMKKYLKSSWGISATVLYDCPSNSFHAASALEAHKLFMKLRPVIDEPMHAGDCCIGEYMAAEVCLLFDCCIGEYMAAEGQDYPAELSICTRAVNESVTWRLQRPAVVVSSTSWTQDEDFSILLSAAEEYNRQCCAMASCTLPRLLIIVTGRGPQKDYYCRQMASMKLEWAAFRTVWLEPEDYPTLLGSADLGVSLHTSSSGLDLPMKVVDMFGCDLPVCSADYSCIQELVTPDVNGRLFRTADELAGHFLDLFECWNGQDTPAALAALRSNLVASKRIRWDDNWRLHALPVIKSSVD
eukprot:CAMPEP_0177791796 /NCGR_PEP_ID=MMETSP0491_2-20121128/24140_1 /TAXON_ID=63592 /ORGANISM="Tetraselmis chuii, Strain PLY429" /LENGTH=475 /DNA_ID=CAMNT_0019314083 /DNA_START=94 /DNA_END=1521 /DNA_ORIENTATION=-